MAEPKIGGAECYRRIKRAFNDAPDTEIAERLGITRSSVSYWRNDKSAPDGRRLIRAAEVTGVQLEWFVTGEEQYFTRDSTLRPHSGPGHDRIAAVIDAEFVRVAKEEGVEVSALISEVAQMLGMPERNLYNYRTGKWSVPASIIPELSMRFKSAAILKEILGEHMTRAMQHLIKGLEDQMNG